MATKMSPRDKLRESIETALSGNVTLPCSVPPVAATNSSAVQRACSAIIVLARNGGLDRIMIAEGKNGFPDFLAFLVALAGHNQHVSRFKRTDRRADRFGPA